MDACAISDRGMSPCCGMSNAYNAIEMDMHAETSIGVFLNPLTERGLLICRRTVVRSTTMVVVSLRV
jgi:hypothetical protein